VNSPALQDTAGLEPLAEGLAGLLARLVSSRDARDRSQPALLQAARAVLLALQDGHTCARLADAAALAADDSPLADPDRLREVLLASGAVAVADRDEPALPLVLAADRLYLLRHYRAERRLAEALRARMAQRPEPAAGAIEALRNLELEGAPDWQAVAVAAALRSRLCVITGGPGTGKTTTIRKVVQVLLAGEPELQIALAAPTGKAAARMGEALQDVLHDARTERATTLHRLLGYLPLEDTFRRSAHSPLPHDVVVVDEASMVDLELMDALLAALKPDARLLLLGDRDQLTSVAAGQVLSDLCATAAPERGVGPELAAFCTQHLDVEVPVAADAGPFADVVVALRQNWRFSADSGIGAFAAEVALRRPDAAFEVLAEGRADLALRPGTDLDALLEGLLPALRAQLDAGSPAAALQALGRLRVLCAVRHGPFGVDALNARIEALLRPHGLLDATHRGRPLLITQNDHQSGLWNGDLGVLWPDDDGRAMAWFQGRDSAPRRFLPLRLPPHETAWAMTVHKSQGSEFDEVLLLLPDRPGPLLHAQLVYTAITRARQKATVAADPELLQQALRTQTARTSGLRKRLLATDRDRRGSP